MPAKIPEAVIGDQVLHYAGGDTNQKPSVALVVDSNGAGKLNLLLYPRNGGTFARPIKGVCHLDDPEVKTRPEHARATGAWETRDEYALRCEEERANRRKATERQAGTVAPPAASTAPKGGSNKKSDPEKDTQ